ncbi:unnamed protein product [Owenia fusiformis]|uniref:E3 SUMO-protein ligase NSE2 n=1 Tax=Owenia fusiformis TaxID=6347 RepID=A0A8J1TMR0_OWEFU|nr:unnamed protein product [Owenia fusiformis]
MAMAYMSHVNKALETVTKVQTYIMAGTEHTTDVALDVVEHEKDSESGTMKVDKLREIMLDYNRMDRDIQQFLEAVDFVKEKIANEDCSNYEDLLDTKLKELQRNNKDETLKQHEKYVEFNQKILQELNGDVADPVMPGPSTLTEDDDIEMTQQDINTKCPYTLKEMVQPVSNIHCKHTYDKKGIEEYIKHKKNRAKCPVAGCANPNPVRISDLADNTALRRYIDRKNRKAGAKHT